MNSQRAMDTRAREANEDAIRDRCPSRIFCWAIEAYLHPETRTRDERKWIEEKWGLGRRENSVQVAFNGWNFKQRAVGRSVSRRYYCKSRGEGIAGSLLFRFFAPYSPTLPWVSWTIRLYLMVQTSFRSFCSVPWFISNFYCTDEARLSRSHNHEVKSQLLIWCSK